VKVLVTGAGGQLGWDVAELCTRSGDEVLALSHAQLDVTDRLEVWAAVSQFRPDVVVHAAAWTAVDGCESDSDKAYRVNALAPRWIAQSAAMTGAYLCYVSTDYVFDGTKGSPYVEWDQTNPLSVYGVSKLGGEKEVLASRASASIVRTSWVCGEHGNNMVKTVLKLADRPELAFVDDQRGHPTFTADLAVAVRRLAEDRLLGTFHVTNQGAVSWYDFVRDILELAGHDPGKVRPISTAELDPPRPAPRPANSVLDNAALRLAGLPLLPHYRDPLEALIKRLQAA
jgi:dTDP-4-dehydrorhamnose reductase